MAYKNSKKDPFATTSFNPKKNQNAKPYNQRMNFEGEEDNENISFSKGPMYYYVDETPHMWSPCCMGQNTIEVSIPCAPPPENMMRQRTGRPDPIPGEMSYIAYSGGVRNQKPGFQTIVNKDTEYAKNRR